MPDADVIEVVEALIVRDPQPNDIIVLRVDPGDITAETAAEIRSRVIEQFGCKCVIFAGGIEVVHVKHEVEHAGR